MVNPEGAHPHGSEVNWQESVFLAWYDADQGVGGVHRIGNEPNRGTSNMWCGVFSREGAAFRWNREGVALEQFPDGRGFICGPQRFYEENGVLRWQLETAECELEITVDDIAGPRGDFEGHEEETSLYVSHFHKNCRASGTVRLGDSRFAVKGYGWRDHSWGPREWTSILNHRCFVGIFPSGESVEYIAITDRDGRLVRNGVLVERGGPHALTDTSMTLALEDDGLTARAAALRGRDGTGRDFSASFEAAGAVLVRTAEFAGIEAVGTITTSSSRSGFGYMAASNNPRAGRADPKLLLEAMDHDGFQASGTK